MSDVKLREALELADAALSGANMNMNVVKKKVKEALAQPAEVVELTDDELLVATLGWREYDRPYNWPKENETRTLYGAGRAAIAAHEAKRRRL